MLLAMKSLSLRCSSLFLIIFSLVYNAFALQFSSPSPGASYKAGGPIDVTWEHEDPPNAPSSGAVPVGLFLYAGGNKEDSHVRFSSV
jgi:hypothetical protein